MATSIVLLVCAAGVGLCLGFLLGHIAAHERTERRGQAARRYRDEHENIERSYGDLSHGYDARFHR